MEKQIKETKNDLGNKLTIEENEKEIIYRHFQPDGKKIVFLEKYDKMERKIRKFDVRPTGHLIEKNEPQEETETTTQSETASKTDINEIQRFLTCMNKEMLMGLIIVPHSKKTNDFIDANYRPKNDTLYVDKTVLDEIKQLRKGLLQSNEPIKQEQPKQSKTPNNTLRHHFPNFQINYRDENKQRIKELIGKIEKDKLPTLKRQQLDATKKDKFGKLNKTNYKKNKNILFYREEDKKHIDFFLTKNNKVKKLNSKYRYRNKFTKTGS